MRKFAILLLLVIVSPAALTAQTSAPCGVVDSMGYPIDGLVEGYDDFGLYRARFGGNHVGIDIGFDRWGDPVRAVAKGRVTYSDTEGWDTEKGVVIIEHTFPDGSIVYTLYGHMEESDVMRFPEVGSCVSQNSTLGGIGWPSRGRPHLHYEIRRFLPNDGGPGYATNNPLDEGWYHPLDFTQLWKMRLEPGFVSATTFDSVPGLPPILLDSGKFVLASGSTLSGGMQDDGSELWQVETDGVITGIAGLPDDRVIAHTRNGQVLTLQNGRYVSLWTVDGLDEPFITLGETLVFATPGGGLEAHNAEGEPLWSLSPVSSAARVTQFTGSGDQVAIGVRADEGGVLWRLVDAAGQINFEATFDQQPVVAPAWDGSWVGLDGAQFKRFSNGQNHTYSSINTAPGRTAAVTSDLLGNAYVYLAEPSNMLVSLDSEGVVRWQTEYPASTFSLSPLMDTGSGCLLYMLDMDGFLHMFNANNGDLVHQVQLYAGGERNSSPRARFLTVDANERIQVGSGFLSLVTLDGWALAGDAMDGCLLG